MGFKFKNVNPINERELDCVCRAITNATQLDYYDILYKLENIGKLFECDELCVCCYKFLLDFVFSFHRVNGYKGYTIKEFIEKNPYGTYLIRVNEHLTNVVDGICYDTWDCTNEIIDIVWSCD